MGFLERIEGSRVPQPRASQRFVMDQYISDYIIPSQFNFNGQSYPIGGLNQTLSGQKTQEVGRSLPGYTAAAMRCPPVFAAQMVRALVLSQARFTFRSRPDTATPRKIFGNRDLSVLEQPWTNATTGELLARMEWHAGLAGNAYVTNWSPDRLRVLRPDWVAIVYGSHLEPDDPGFALDGEIVGYAYQNGGFTSVNTNPVRTLRAEEVAHWSPLPDPLSPGLGMSWLTPGLRDIQGDQAMTEHKLRFFENGATPNLVIKGLPAVTKEQFDGLVDSMEANHTGIRNAYRTLYLNAGADATVVGSDIQQLAFAETQGKGETRLAMLSRVPAPILQISEGLQGSSLNAGNFTASRRTFADTWVYPTLQDACRALAPLVNVPSDAELWYDVADMPLLREDAKDIAEIMQMNAQTIGGLVKDGFTPESSVKAVVGQNMNLLKPIPGWLSVQLQPGGAGGAPAVAAPTNGAPPANGKAQEPAMTPMKPTTAPVPAMRSMDMMPMPPAMPPVNVNVTIPERQVVIQTPTMNFQPQVSIEAPPIQVPITVLPGTAPDVTIEGDQVTVQPAAVSIPVTVQPANAPAVTIEAPVTVTTPEVQVQPAAITVDARTTPQIVMPAPKPTSKKIRMKRSDGSATTVDIEEA